jgi:tRNA (mo5U34)-methyltransferase
MQNKPSIQEAEALITEMNKFRWFHQIDFGGGLISPGLGQLVHLKAAADTYFADGIEGKSILDVGCWDGFNSIEAKKRGAGRVLATDHFAWSDQCWGDRRAFDLARRHLAPEIEVMDIDVPDLTVEVVGQFDLVLFCGVFYHLRHPFLALESVAKLTRETLIVETAMDAPDVERPAMIFYPTNELNNDASNWWGPNRPCLEAMLRDVGFRTVQFTAHPTITARGTLVSTSSTIGIKSTDYLAKLNQWCSRQFRPSADWTISSTMREFQAQRSPFQSTT